MLFGKRSLSHPLSPRLRGKDEINDTLALESVSNRPVFQPVERFYGNTSRDTYCKPELAQATSGGFWGGHWKIRENIVI